MDSTILQILGKHGLPVSEAFINAMRDAYKAGALAVDSSDGDGDDNDTSTTLSASDAAAIRALGVDPTKPFRLRNSLFTICGYKPSRWKYPISAVTQTGARYKFTAAQIKLHQRAM